jgi:hypothetical protein
MADEPTTSCRRLRHANVGFERQNGPELGCELGDLAAVGEGCEEQLWDLALMRSTGI